MNILSYLDESGYGIHRVSGGESCPDGIEGLTAWLPEGFPSPFRYVPCGAVRKAASILMDRIGSSEELSKIFAEGKMLGVLIVEDRDGKIGFLSGFSGNVGGRSIIEGFVPPVFDLLDPRGHYKVREKEISLFGERIAALQDGGELAGLREELRRCENQARIEIESMKVALAESRKRRESIRQEISSFCHSERSPEGNSFCHSGQSPEGISFCHSERSPEGISYCHSERSPEGTTVRNLPATLIRQSQHEKATLRRLKKDWEEKLSVLRQKEKAMTDTIAALKAERKSMSDELQKWIFHQYVVHDALGRESTIWDIFAQRGIVPPGGTGECAAPKMLEYAYRHGLKPLAMGEFWYGESPRTAVRVHGHFYPSCTSKCGPLLGFMMHGLDVLDMTVPECDLSKAAILHIDDDIIVASKPSGMPSVPGLDGRISLQERLSDETGSEVLAVHRLDMDTSGVIVFARNSSAQSDLRSQFENRTVRKTYVARLCPPDPAPFPEAPAFGTANSVSGKPGSSSEGMISLPLSPDYDERPRQKADMANGKEAVTQYRILKEYPDGTTDVEFRPLTGRTHQLRVHSAHPLGLGRPIAGDLLYGGYSAVPEVRSEVSTARPARRLHLHALSLAFTHPVSRKELTFSSLKLSF
ncbi:MAG: RluA family pseudouridine synthase [Candidatus Cryptobacteroides sp.]